MDNPNFGKSPKTNIIPSAPVPAARPPTYEESKLNPLVAPPSGGNQFMFMRAPIGHTPAPMRQITMEEVAQHNKVNDCWTVINSKVYDITAYIQYHPGGRVILKGAGKDGTALFQKYHPWVNCEALIGRLQIGYLSTK